MNNINEDLALSMINIITTDLDKIVEVHKFNLDSLTVAINDLDDEEKENVIEKIINKQLLELKSIDEINIIDVFEYVDDITDYYIRDCDWIGIVSECDDIANDLVFKILNKNNRTINIPVKISYIKDYCISSSIDKEKMFKCLLWIALRLITINYCIKKSVKL